MRERVLITGGAGFIASHLAASHLASGDEVHLLVRPGGPAHPERIQPDTEVHEVDLADRGLFGFHGAASFSTHSLMAPLAIFRLWTGGK